MKIKLKNHTTTGKQHCILKEKITFNYNNFIIIIIFVYPFIPEMLANIISWSNTTKWVLTTQRK